MHKGIINAGWGIVALSWLVLHCAVKWRPIKIIEPPSIHSFLLKFQFTTLRSSGSNRRYTLKFTLEFTLTYDLVERKFGR